jgi:outer membrane biosynthesis protein TonB
MEPRRIIRKDIAASVVAHLTLVALIVLISEVRPFQAPPSDTVAVDIVTPEELKEKVPEPAPSPQISLPDLTAKDKAEAPLPASPPSPPQPAQQASPQPQPSPQPTPSPRREANAQPPAQPAPQAPSYKPPEPDVTVKYGVMLGLPGELPPLPKETTKENDAGGAADSEAAKLASSVTAEFRRHLKTCAKLPASIGLSDNVHVKLRTFMTTDGRLAAAPALIEASASPAKGLALMQAAKAALEACQPYTMLPADKYQEWKVLDLNFTPRDFGAS